MLTAAEDVRMDPGALESIRELFWEQIKQGLHPGATLAVYRYGKPVLDLYGGVADTSSGRAVTHETLFVLFSSTKPLASACIYILKDRGKLDWDDKVGKYWPEFSQNGHRNYSPRLDPQGRLSGNSRRIETGALGKLVQLGHGGLGYGTSKPAVEAWDGVGLPLF